jgi:hypothetical protein
MVLDFRDGLLRSYVEYGGRYTGIDLAAISPKIEGYSRK